jgi:branched-chain amino acid transport system permease protein
MLPELLRFLSDYRMLIYAIVLIVMMLFNWSPKSLELRERYSPKRLMKKKQEEKEGA